jgi:surfactin synthase thioesterase subunit
MLMDMLPPMLRADFTLYETYQYHTKDPLACLITVFKGRHDTFAKAEDMGKWQQQTQALYKEIDYTGGHFFSMNRGNLLANT